MTMMENRHNERVLTTVISNETSMDKLRTQYRYRLNQLADAVNLPYGMTLEGRITTDSFNNYSLYVFIRKDGETFRGAPSKGNYVNYIDETVGGRWVRLNRQTGEFFYGVEWEAREIKEALAEYLEAQKEAGK